MFCLSGLVTAIIGLLTLLWRERVDRPRTSSLLPASQRVPGNA
jgi:hypothetical protein